MKRIFQNHWLGGPWFRCHKPLPPKRSKHLIEVTNNKIWDMPYESQTEHGPAISVVFRKRDELSGKPLRQFQARTINTRFSRKRRLKAMGKIVLKAVDATKDEIWSSVLIWKALHA